MKVLKYIVIAIVGFFVTIFIVDLTTQSYNPPELREGDGCEYGYNEYKKICCDDEDDYSCVSCGYDEYDCADFEDQDSAQYKYDECREYSNFEEPDIHELDEDGDGVACESLIPVRD